MKKYLVFFLLCVSTALQAGNAAKMDSAAIEQQIRSMTLEQLAAQTMIIRINNQYTAKYAAEASAMIAKIGYGGVCFFKGTATDMLPLAQVLRDSSKIPLWITIDGEWGPAMRLTDISKFPLQQTLGAISDNNLIYKMGELVGEQCRTLGITWNFIPTADINSEPRNPVIGMRSFGENPYNVAEKCKAYNAGVLSKNIMTSAKHFPGHGNTKVDSHYDLPLVEDFDSTTLIPFKTLINNKVSSIMVGHLNVPHFDTSGRPATMSPNIVTELLKNKMAYKGLVVSDGLEMRGVLRSDSLIIASRFKNWHNTTGEVEVQALLAGIDVLLLPENSENSIKRIVEAVRQNRLPLERLQDAVRKILTAKNSSEFLELYNTPVPNADSAVLLTNNENVKQLNKLLFDNAVTLLKNNNAVIPVNKSKYKNIVMLDDDTAHSNAIMADSTQFAAMQDTSAFIIFRVKNTNILAAKKYGITQQTTQLAEQIANTPASKLLVIYASPYALSFFDTSTLNKFDAILVAYQDMDEAQMAVSSIIFGEKPAKGHLPVSVFTQDGQKIYSTGAGLSTIQNELYTALPESTGWKSEWMQSIDSIALSGIAAQAYPGCQILVAKGNAVIYNKSFGHFTYDKDVTPKVENSDIYDLASLSKIFGTTLSYMKIYEDSCFNLDDHISKVIHRLSRSAKGKLTYRQLLAHQAGLKATLQWLPADNIYQRHEILSRKYDEDDYPYQVADSVFLYKNYRNQIRKMIDESPLAEKPKYVYSDLGFYYLNEAFQSITKESIDKFATDSFYKPMGLKNIGYHPLQWVSLSRIAPTENDTLFRKQVVKGYVHDPLIALSGGVGGSAGLFGNAYDVAVLCRMLLQGGVYADKQYLQPETIALFTSSDFSSEWNRRAGGFDKPLLKPNGTSPCCEQASPSSFGHSGFTGTYFWVDPEHDLIYIFLSNRIYPNASPNKLASMNIRTKIQELLYEFDAKEQ